MNQGMDRRKFIKGVGVAVLSVHFLPLVARASGSDEGDAENNLIIHSGPGLFSHAHDLLIPYAVLREPPVGGVKLKTTRALLHTHEVTLTQDELRTVNQGGTVTGNSGKHLFVIALAHRQDHISPEVSARPSTER